jgi:queuine tRNA-ribosyltransferase
VPLAFEIKARAGNARTGKLLTPHGEVETPVFMPVGTLATVKGTSNETLEQLGAQIILANTYHLYLRPGTEQVRNLGGLHRFMSWNRALLTDSGGFQVFSLNELRRVTEEGVSFRSHLDGASLFLSPESATEAQIALGADIIMAFDECTEYPADEARTRKSMEMTLRWALRSKEHFEKNKHLVPWGEVGSGQWRVASENQGPSTASAAVTSARDDYSRSNAAKVSTGNRELRTGNPEATQSLFGIVQGGMHPQLRKESAERTVEIGFDGYAIGGLSVGEPRASTREMIEATLPHLPADRPRYVMGVGYPEEIVEYAAMGVDMMDCVLPTRAARHGLLFTSEGRVNIKNAVYAADQGPIDPNCGCAVCSRYTRAYLRHLYSTGEMLGQVLNTIHNLAHYLDTMRRVRDAIQSGNLQAFVSGFRSRLQSNSSVDSATLS